MKHLILQCLIALFVFGCDQAQKLPRLSKGLDAEVKLEYHAVEDPRAIVLQPLDSDLVSLVADKLIAMEDGYTIHYFARDRLQTRDSILVNRKPNWTYRSLRQAALSRKPLRDGSAFRLQFAPVVFDTTAGMQRLLFLFALENRLPDTISQMRFSLILCDKKGNRKLDLPAIETTHPIPGNGGNAMIKVSSQEYSRLDSDEQPGMYSRRSQKEVDRLIQLLRSPREQRWKISIIQIRFADGSTLYDYGLRPK